MAPVSTHLLLAGQAQDWSALWQAWRLWLAGPDRSSVHWVVLASPSPSPPGPSSDTGLDAAHCQAWAQQAWGLMAGWHRLVFDQGAWCVTLGLGDWRRLLAQARLQAQQVVVLGPMPPAACATGPATSEPAQPCAPAPQTDQSSSWSRFDAAALARVCAPAAVLDWLAPPPALGQWQSAGWLPDAPAPGAPPPPPGPATPAVPPSTAPTRWRWAPHWLVRRTRGGGAPSLSSAPAPHTQRQALVVGAGLAGAAVAAALAQRGWQVCVVDAASAPAAGASGLPVGLVAAHTSSDDCVLSRLSRAGVRLMLQALRTHTRQGLDWGPSGALEHQVHGTPKLPAGWPSDAAHTDWSRPHADGLWHTHAAWVRPAALVRAWLTQPGVRFVGGISVADLRATAQGWQLIDAQGQAGLQAPLVVLANAAGAWGLHAKLLSNKEHLTQAGRALQPKIIDKNELRGQLSWARHVHTPAAPFAAHPVHGAGTVVAHVPDPAGAFWAVGSSYQPAEQTPRSVADNHARNLAHLAEIDPALAQALNPLTPSAHLQAWGGVRCIPRDRLPVVGPLDASAETPGRLWICAGMGSRGLSFSALCAELLAAQLHGEPWPVGADLARHLSAQRCASNQANTPV